MSSKWFSSIPRQTLNIECANEARRRYVAGANLDDLGALFNISARAIMPYLRTEAVVVQSSPVLDAGTAAFKVFVEALPVR